MRQETARKREQRRTVVSAFLEMLDAYELGLRTAFELETAFAQLTYDQAKMLLTQKVIVNILESKRGVILPNKNYGTLEDTLRELGIPVLVAKINSPKSGKMRCVLPSQLEIAQQVIASHPELHAPAARIAVQMDGEEILRIPTSSQLRSESNRHEGKYLSLRKLVTEILPFELRHSFDNPSQSIVWLKRTLSRKRECFVFESENGEWYIQRKDLDQVIKIIKESSRYVLPQHNPS